METESRFTHLLQPIRELTKNWDVDVASELNDYLEELEEMCITFDGGRTQLNFAEAALLIQGSACIYSKKVELLHSLVYQTLEYINERNKRQKKVTAAEQDGDTSRAAKSHDADDMEFTPLDLEASDSCQDSDSSSVVMVTPLPPEALIPPESHEKLKLPLISARGEVLCSQKDFWINLCVPGDQDLILLALHPASRLRLDQDQDQDQDQEVPQPPADAEEDFLPLDHMDLDQDPDPGQDQDLEEHVERQKAPAEGRVLRERRQLEARGHQDQDQDQDPGPPSSTSGPGVSVWTLHDPYAPAGEDKPFKSGKCYRVPDGLDDGGKRKRKKAAPLQDFSSWFRGTFDPPERKLKSGPRFTDLNYVYLSSLKQRIRTQRRICRRQGVLLSDEELRRSFLRPEGAGPDHQGEEPVEGWLGGGDSEDEQEGPAEFGPDLDLDPAEAQREELTYEDLVKLRVDQLVVSSRGYTQETALSRRVKEWEDQIQPQLLMQDQRGAFDIRAYGERVAAALGGVGRRRAFSSVVSGMEPREACRLLLATLQLANDLTVQLDSSGRLDEALDSVSVTLLSTSRAADRFRSLAPPP
ncbi:condensin-2 complex subunit H2 [Menidia menidia]